MIIFHKVGPSNIHMQCGEDELSSYQSEENSGNYNAVARVPCVTMLLVSSSRRVIPFSILGGGSLSFLCCSSGTRWDLIGKKVANTGNGSVHLSLR